MADTSPAYVESSGWRGFSRLLPEEGNLPEDGELTYLSGEMQCCEEVGAVSSAIDLSAFR